MQSGEYDYEIQDAEDHDDDYEVQEEETKTMRCRITDYKKR